MSGVTFKLFIKCLAAIEYFPAELFEQLCDELSTFGREQLGTLEYAL